MGGFALGGGCELVARTSPPFLTVLCVEAMSCDIIVASEALFSFKRGLRREAAKFGQPEIKRGG